MNATSKEREREKMRTCCWNDLFYLCLSSKWKQLVVLDTTVHQSKKIFLVCKRGILVWYVGRVYRTDLVENMKLSRISSDQIFNVHW